jgi:autotransporter-associated beta strand protein
MRAHLLVTTAAVALLGAMPARAQDATWLLNPGSGVFNTAANWTPPTVPTGTAFFGPSNTTSLTFSTATTVGGFTFNTGAPAYSFNTGSPNLSLTFNGAGITNNSQNSPSFVTNGTGALIFGNSSTAGNAIITNDDLVLFTNTSNAGSATITNNNVVTFRDAGTTAANATIINNSNSVLGFSSASTAANATIVTNNNATTFFFDNSTAGLAQLVTNAGGTVDFSGTRGPAGNGTTSAGSIAGAGSYSLGSQTLTVGGNNLSSEVSGTIQNGGLFGGVGGSLVKVGTGALTLSGVNAYTGTTTVNAGALIVNGSIALSSLTTVNGGAELIGSGTVGPTAINAGGFLVPGPVGVPGSMTVAGNLAFQSGAFYVVQVNPTTASTTNVTGTASLAGTVEAFFAPGTYGRVRSYTILTAASGVTGTFDALATLGLPPDFGARLNYTGNTAVLNLFAQLVPEPTPPTPTAPVPPLPGFPPTAQQPPAPPPPPFTVNQLNVGHAIDNFFNNGGALPPTFVSLFGLTGSNLTNALDQLSGEVATGAQKVGFQLTDQFLNLMLDPFVDGRGCTEYPVRPIVRGRLPMPVCEGRWTTWVGAYGGGNHTAGDLTVIGSHDLSARTVGGAAGLDYRLTPDTVLGFALAGGGTNWSLSQGLGSGKSDAFQAGLYGTTRWVQPTLPRPSLSPITGCPPSAPRSETT